MDPRPQDHPDTVGVGLTNEVRSWLEGLEPRHLAEFLIGGVAGQDLPQSEGAEVVKMYNDYLGHSSFILPPCPTPNSPATPPAGSTAA